MPRIQLFEIHDYAWCPAVLRDSLTALMRWAIDLLHVYDPVVPHIHRLLQHSTTREIVDLCSGGAGPWSRLGGAVDRAASSSVPVRLTDKYPNLDAFEWVKNRAGGGVGFIAASVDAANVPPDLKGVRTLFSSFHHFPPSLARQILRDAAAKRAPIGVFEFTERSLLGFAGMLFTPLVALLVVPFLRPFSWRRGITCLPLPILPLLATWDGFVSNLRTYSPRELRALTDTIDVPGYRWESGRISRGLRGLPVTYLLGFPVASTDPESRDLGLDGAA